MKLKIMKLNLYIQTQKWIKDLNIGSERIKLFEDSMGESLLTAGLGNDMFVYNTRNILIVKGKIKLMELTPTIKLLHSKINDKQNETVASGWENICNPYV